MLQVNVVIRPLVVEAGVELQELTPEALPVAETVHCTLPVGATEPVTPVTVAVKTMVDPTTPVPVPLTATTGVACAMVTSGVETTAARPV
jgi:hypothetical protein